MEHGLAEGVRSAWNSLRPQELEDPLDALLPIVDPLKGFGPAAFKRPVASDRPDEPVDRQISSGANPVRRLFLQCVQSVEVLSWKESLDCQTQKALKRWYNLVLVWQADLTIVKQISAVDVGEGMDILADYLRPKAPSTLLKRASSLFLLDRLMAGSGVLFPPSEQLFYEVLREMRESGGSESGRKGILEAVAFCYYVLDISECEDLVFSRRCRGACHVEARARTNQAAPFKVSEVLGLHELVHSAEDFWDSVFAGCVLLAIYLRSRWADLQCCEALELDLDAQGTPCFVDLVTSRHKSMQARQHRHQFLQMSGPCVGVTDRQWVEVWLKKCEEVKFTPCKGGWPVMPAPDAAGRPTVRPLSSGEMSSWIRKLMPGAAEEDRKLSSHSAKCTLLSWMAKFGAPQDVRACLGYHVGTSKTIFRYSRDAAAGPLYELGRMLSWVRNGWFHPDNTRSGRFSSEDDDERAWWEQVRDYDEQAVQQEDVEIGQRSPFSWSHDQPEESASFPGGVAWDQDLEEVSEPAAAATPAGGGGEANSSEDEGASSSSESDGSGAGPRPPRLLYPPTAPDGTSFTRHLKSRVCRLKKDGYVRRLMCGRPVTSAYGSPGLMRYDTSVCSQCLRAAAADR